MSKQIKGVSKKVFALFVVLTTILLQAGILLVKPQVALADTLPPNIRHWSVSMVDGDATATTTAGIFAFAGDDTASPGGAPDLTMTAFYQDDAWATWAFVTCQSQYANSRLFKCDVPITPGTDARTVHYYLRAHDGTNYSFASWSTNTTATTSAQSAPYQVTVYNTPSWTNAISGLFTTSTNAKWPGAKNGRCTSLMVSSPNATNTFYVSESAARDNGLAMTPNEWFLIAGTDKLQISSTSTSGSNLQIITTGYSTQAYTATACLHEFVGNAVVWIDGTAISATSSSENSTSTFGTFTLPYVPDGSWELVGFKTGYMDQHLMGISLFGTATTTVDIYLPFGDFSGGGDMEGGRVIWSAPGEGSMGAPNDIRLSASPILIAVSEDLNASTITTSTVTLQRMSPDGSTSLATGYSVIYEPRGGSVSLGGTSYDFGPEAKIIVYASTTASNLATSTGYSVRISSNVTDVNGVAISGNDPQGGHSIFFSTMGGNFSGGVTVGQFGTGGMYMPPFVNGMVPSDGAINVAQNTKIAIKFDQPIDSNSLSGYIQLWRLSNFAESSQAAFSAALDRTDQALVILTPTSNLAQARYRVKILGGVRSASGVTMAMPGQESQQMFGFEFEVGASVDNASTTIRATSLDTYLSSGAYTGVPTSGLFKIAFSEPVNPGTINTNTIKLRQRGSTSDISGTATYDIMEGKAIFRPSSALNATTTYVLYLYSGINDLTKAANCLATTTYEFTTGSADDVRPRLEFINADDYRLSLTFSEPMNAAAVSDTSQWSSGSSKWSTSILNPANYIVYVDSGAPPASATLYQGGNSLASTTNLTFTYDASFNSVKIEGLSLTAGGSGGVRVWVKNVTDISGNVIQTNASPNSTASNFGANSMGGPVFNSSNTFGMVGPGAGMMGPPSSAGGFSVTDFGGKNPAMMGMMPVGIWPMNMVAGATSIYMIDIPVSSAATCSVSGGCAIPAGGKIVIGPFPGEANVSGAKNADPNASFAHFDINGPGSGRVVLGTAAESSGGLTNDGVTVSGRVVTITLGTSVPTQAPDFLHLELDGIRNPTTPTQGGYKINIQTQDANSRQLESFTSMPFFLMPKGIYTIVGYASTTPNVGLNGIQIFGGSPSTGPLFTTTANNAFGSSTDGEFQIEGLNAGNVMISPEPYISVGGNEYIAPMAEPMYLDNTNCANSKSDAKLGITGCTSNTACYCYKQFNLSKVVAGATPGLTVQITGDFSATGVGSNSIDIFAGGSGGFRVRTLTMNQNYTATGVGATTTTFNLPGTGDFHVGIGPAMPKGPMGMASPPMPDDWMPPKDEWVSVSSSTNNWVWFENSGTVNDGTVEFTIQVASHTIQGYVRDPSGTAVPNAEVFAYSPTEFYGSNTHVNQDGSFTLHVTDGFYKVGAFLPGAPPSNETGVRVDSSGNVYVEGTLVTSPSGFILKLSKNIQSGYTLSGTIYSDTNSQYPAADASVYAYRTDGPGHSETMTDSKGAYTLYVSTGTWNVGVYLSDYGNLAEQTITVPPSKSGLNFAPAANITYVTIRERVWQDANDNGTFDAGEGVARATVAVVSTSSDYVNTAVTDSNGVYEVKVPASTVYDFEAWSPDIGSLPPQKNKAVTSTDIIYSSFSGFADVDTGHATTVEITFYDSSGNATTVEKVLVQLDQAGVEGVSNDVFKENVATTTMKVASSSNPYILDIEIKGIPKNQLTIIAGDNNTSVGSTTVASNLYSTTTVDGYEKIKVFLPALSNVSGQARDENGTAIAGAILHVEQPGTDIEFDVEANSSGNYSFKVPSTTTPYLVQITKSGYIDSAVSLTASTTTTSFNPTATTTSRTISGTISVAGAVPGTSVYVWAEKLGGGYVSTAQADSATGAYTLNVVDGNWEVSAVVEGYSQNTLTTIAEVNGSNVSAVNLAAGASMLSSLQKQGTLGMTGNVGGTLKNKSAGFEMAVPNSTLSASDSSSYNVKEKEISNIPGFTPNSNLIGNKAEEISAYKMSGSGGSVSTVSSLSGAAFVDKIFTKAELAAEGIDTVAEIEQSKMGSYDNAVQNWKNLPTTITYLDSSEYPVIPASNLSNVAKVVFNGVTKHFSTIGVVNTGFDGLAPAAPKNITITSAGRDITVSWSAVSTNDDGTTASDVTGYNVWRSTSTNGPWNKVGTVAAGTSSFSQSTDNSAIALGTTYYYKVTADSGLQSGFSVVSGAGQVLAVVSAPSTGGVSAAPAAEEVAAPAGGAAETVSPTMPQTSSGQVAATAAAGGKTSLTTTENTKAAVEAPAAALSADTTLSISAVAKTATAVSTAAAAVPSGKAMVGGYVYNYTATAAGQAVTTFANSVTLTLTYTDEQISGLEESTLQVYYWNEHDAAWVGLSTTVNAANNTLTATTNHFTYFAIMGQEEEVTVPQVSFEKPIAEMTIEELQAKITEILAAINALQQLLTQLAPTGIEGIPAGFSFEISLKMKSKGDDVKYLQIVLNSSADTRLAASGVGSPGKETTFFGNLTKTAVIAFQEKYAAEILAGYGLTKGTGYVGKTTRDKLNELIK